MTKNPFLEVLTKFPFSKTRIELDNNCGYIYCPNFFLAKFPYSCSSPQINYISNGTWIKVGRKQKFIINDIIKCFKTDPRAKIVVPNIITNQETDINFESLYCRIPLEVYDIGKQTFLKDLVDLNPTKEFIAATSHYYQSVAYFSDKSTTLILIPLYSKKQNKIKITGNDSIALVEITDGQSAVPGE